MISVVWSHVGEQILRTKFLQSTKQAKCSFDTVLRSKGGRGGQTVSLRGSSNEVPVTWDAKKAGHRKRGGGGGVQKKRVEREEKHTQQQAVCGPIN